MATLIESLVERVETLIEASKSEMVLASTPTPAAIAELFARSEAQELALREIAQAVAQLAQK